LDTDEAEWQRGRRDRDAGLPPSGGRVMDTSKMEELSAIVGNEWAQRPDWTLFKMLYSLVFFSALWGAIAAAVSWPIHAWLWGGLYTSNAPNLLSSLNWGLKIGGFFFFLGGVLTVGQIMGSMTRRFTLLGLLAFFALTGTLVYIVWWLYALSAGLVTSPTWMR
jgi:hypothetical protein